MLQAHLLLFFNIKKLKKLKKFKKKKRKSIESTVQIKFVPCGNRFLVWTLNTYRSAVLTKGIKSYSPKSRRVINCGLPFLLLFLFFYPRRITFFFDKLLSSPLCKWVIPFLSLWAQAYTCTFGHKREIHFKNAFVYIYIYIISKLLIQWLLIYKIERKIRKKNSSIQNNMSPKKKKKKNSIFWEVKKHKDKGGGKAWNRWGDGVRVGTDEMRLVASVSRGGCIFVHAAHHFSGLLTLRWVRNLWNR